MWQGIKDSCQGGVLEFSCGTNAQVIRLTGPQSALGTIQKRLAWMSVMTRQIEKMFYARTVARTSVSEKALFSSAVFPESFTVFGMDTAKPQGCQGLKGLKTSIFRETSSKFGKSSCKIDVYPNVFLPAWRGVISRLWRFARSLPQFSSYRKNATLAT